MPDANEMLAEALRARGLSVAAGESCTGGLLSKLITDVPGSSQYFKGGTSAYDDHAKVSLLGVKLTSITQFGAVSREVASEMADGARLKFRSEVGIGITGIAGPGGGTPEKPVGLVFIAVSVPGRTFAREFQFHGSRADVRRGAADAAMQMAIEEIEMLPVKSGESSGTGEFRIGVLASGGGTDLQSILDACGSGYIPGKVVVVISNVEDAGALDRARKHGAAALFIDHRKKAREEHEREVGDALDKHGVQLVVLAGYLRILTPYFVRRFLGRLVNIHPALLPGFGGKGMHGERVHRAVLEAGCRLSGCSVHFVDESVDGGPIIAQRAVDAKDGDTPETLAARVLEQEHLLLPYVVKLIAEGKVSLADGKVRVRDTP
ncbi:MAG: phosphoribosylglycinamide formyltransferase [Euryarchaeota archaeon]|nr:phosphoribosylglycinamide formyltransferase [Euryarchaeota archaeon]